MLYEYFLCMWMLALIHLIFCAINIFCGYLEQHYPYVIFKIFTDDLDNSLLKYIGLFSYQEIIFRLWICEWGGYFHITICNPFAMY